MLRDQLLTETMEIARKYADRYIPEAIPARSVWTRHHRPGVVMTREPRLE